MAFNKKSDYSDFWRYIFLVCFKNLNNENYCLKDIHLHSVQSNKFHEAVTLMLIKKKKPTMKTHQKPAYNGIFNTWMDELT